MSRDRRRGLKTVRISVMTYKALKAEEARWAALSLEGKAPKQWQIIWAWWQAYAQANSLPVEPPGNHVSDGA